MDGPRFRATGDKHASPHPDVTIGGFVQPSARDPQDRYLRFLVQLGVTHVVAGGQSHPRLDELTDPQAWSKPTSCWTASEVMGLRVRCEAAGLSLIAIENPLPPWCWDHIILGLPGRDRQIENVIATVRAAAEGGVSILGYNWMVNPPEMYRRSWRTAFSLAGRGGARVSEFDLAAARDLPLARDRVYVTDELWANYAYFIQAVAPEAEAAGVRLALHPDDPPVASLGGVARIANSFENFQQLLTIADSQACGLNFCMGNWTAMGADVPAAAHYFASRGQICYGHVQGLRGAVPAFRECFLDEADCDFRAVLQALYAAGFDGFLGPQHMPEMDNDDGRQQAFAFAYGYLRGLVHSIERPTTAPTGQV